MSFQGTCRLLSNMSSLRFDELTIPWCRSWYNSCPSGKPTNGSTRKVSLQRTSETEDIVGCFIKWKQHHFFHTDVSTPDMYRSSGYDLLIDDMRSFRAVSFGLIHALCCAAAEELNKKFWSKVSWENYLFCQLLDTELEENDDLTSTSKKRTLLFWGWVFLRPVFCLSWRKELIQGCYLIFTRRKGYCFQVGFFFGQFPTVNRFLRFGTGPLPIRFKNQILLGTYNIPRIQGIRIN